MKRLFLLKYAMNLHTIHTTDAIGNYGTDDTGAPWATFQVFHHEVACADCGKSIHSGWQRGRFGEQLTHHCADHITVIRTEQQ
jgi:hypothetical protein